MSKFRERFKDKISIVGRDGVQVHVSSGQKVSAGAEAKPQEQRGGRGGKGSGRPAPRGGAGYAGARSEVDANGTSPRDEGAPASRQTSFVPSHPPQPSHIPPPVVTVGPPAVAGPVATVHRGEPQPPPPPASQPTPTQPPAQPPAVDTLQPQPQGPTPGSMPMSPAHLLAQQQHLLQLQNHQQQLLLMQQRMQQQPPSAAPALMSDAEWLKQASEASQLQLFQLQNQLGLQQQLPPPSVSPETLDPHSQMSTPLGYPPPYAYPQPAFNASNNPPAHTPATAAAPPSAAANPAQPRTAPSQGQAAPAKDIAFGRRKGSSKSAEGKARAGSDPGPRPGHGTPKAGASGTPKQGPNGPPPQVPGDAKFGRRAMDGPPSYKPYTMADYKQINQPVKLGGLGPDDSEEKQQLRNQKKAALSYANKVRSTNEEKTSAMVQNRGRLPIIKQPTAQQKAAAERRAKALEFASKVPKPKPVGEEAASPSSPQRMPTAAEVEIMNMEAQHQKDQEAIREIKKNLGLAV
eukprot:TRINITY_DN16154_c0_g1_i1.p1 TRINITY_DN16154_c0_g1~~TRINITY_DN16154_c0_g1_i1.p1  ORF type:complete len:518 (+),score=124.60 TRINITY_DN16154_c0_g1_i1:60-1613(+)